MIPDPLPLTTLEGTHVRLEPLSLAHVDALVAVGLDASLWRLMPTPVTNAAEMRAYVEEAIGLRERGVAMPFATVDRASNTVVGSTRFTNIDRANRHVEIGWTWITPRFQRSAINTESKYLLLRHAFDIFGCLRVELKTDALNTQSRAAMERIGATFEGVFRKDRVVPGRIRSTAWYSFTDDDWVDARPRIETMLALQPTNSPRNTE